MSEEVQNVEASLPACVGGPARTLAEALKLNGPDDLFPWQRELLRLFLAGEIPPALDIPTGLGKTAVMAIWLIARAFGAALPRRLVYVVDRRAVVDQATTAAEDLREHVDEMPELQGCLGLDRDRPMLPISTLRGQYVDNQEWLEDPASPAIIVGTVDMVGSRLLFQGYGVSRRMRPYHAAMLGVDALVVLDEAHLVPPFERLLEAIAQGSKRFGPRGDELRALIPPFALMSLSATRSATERGSVANALRLGPADHEHPIAKERLEALKRIELRTIKDGEKLAELIADAAWELTDSGSRPLRCIVFCDSRRDAQRCMERIDKRAKGKVDTELFVGARRVHERQDAADKLEDLGFLAQTETSRSTPAFLFATSAAEVGVDLDANCMVCDLVAWERMVQRLGRVNRRGTVLGGADIVVFAPKDATPERSALELLPEVDDLVDTRHASPAAILRVIEDARTDDRAREIIAAATTKEPPRPELTRALVDAWAMNSLEDHPGRPRILDPWLRGWQDKEQAETRVVWRRHLPVRKSGPDVTPREIEAFFKAARPHLSEALDTDTSAVVEWLTKRAAGVMPNEADRSTHSDADPALLAADDTIAFVLTPSGKLKRSPLTLREVTPPPGKHSLSTRDKHLLRDGLAGAMLVLDARIAGLAGQGLLDPAITVAPGTADNANNADAWPEINFQVHRLGSDEQSTAVQGCRERYRFRAKMNEDDSPALFLVVYGRLGNPEDEEARSVTSDELLDHHVKRVEDHVRRLAKSLLLPDDYATALLKAATLHDIGKATDRWQRAFNARLDERVYGKTKGPINHHVLDGYRHELGTLAKIALNQTEGPEDLRPDLHELVLHIIAAHHGRARPCIETHGFDGAPPSVLGELATAIALRYARLQRQWGPWGLAWWEALLRAADQQASRKAAGETSTQEAAA